jgi:hypothetical protein
MNERTKAQGKISTKGKDGNKTCDGCCERCHKISDGVYTTPFFSSQQIAKKRGVEIS